MLLGNYKTFCKNLKKSNMYYRGAPPLPDRGAYFYNGQFDASGLFICRYCLVDSFSFFVIVHFQIVSRQLHI